MLLLIIPIGYGLEECQTPSTKKDIPCMLKSTWDYTDCSTTQIKIYNSTPTLLGIKNFTDYGASGRCNITWNYSTIDSYFWNVSNGDSGSLIVEEEDSMIIAIIIIIPLIIGILFMVGSAVLGEQHTILKIFLFLLSLITFFSSFHFGMLAVIEYFDFPALQNAIGTTTYWVGMSFAMIIVYFIIYFIIVAFHTAAQKKAARFEY